MARDINQVIQVGRLTRDMEMKFTAGGMAIGHIGIAVNRRVKKGEQWDDEANFFDATVFGKQAEGLQPYLLKGQQVAIVGELRQERWKDQQGNNRSKVSIAVADIQLLGGKRDGDQGTAPSHQEAAQTTTTDNAPPRGFDDDIPF